MNKQLVVILIVIIFILGGLLYVYNSEPTTYQNEVACTMDAMLCPDGSYVGRQGPNCEFAPCPIPEGAMMEDGTIE